MNDKSEDPFGMTSIVNSWMKNMGDLWGHMADFQTAVQGRQASGKMGGGAATANAHQAMMTALKNWQTMTTGMASPESMAALLKGSGTMPEVLLKLAQTALGSCMELQQNMIQRLGRLGSSVEAYQFQDIDENVFRLWTEIYEKEFRQFFQIPQLGLMRTYQEKANQAADKFNLFQSNLAEFLRMLGLPFSHSLQVMQEKLGKMAEKGELTDDTRAYYQMWVKVLEGHFMTLFQTPEYVETLARTVNALADFSAARDAALEDVLNLLPVARKSDMDDMARELYELKKRLRKLEKKSNP